MIVKLNQYRGGNIVTFPKIGIIASFDDEIQEYEYPTPDYLVVEIQKDVRQVLRDILHIDEDMDLDEMRNLSQYVNVFAVVQKVMRPVRMLNDPPLDAVKVFNENGILIGYQVEPYPVLVASYVTMDEVDAFRTEPCLQDKKEYLESIELKNNPKTIADRKAVQDANAARLSEAQATKDKAAADRRAARLARLNGTAVPAQPVEPASSEKISNHQLDNELDNDSDNDNYDYYDPDPNHEREQNIDWLIDEGYDPEYD